MINPSASPSLNNEGSYLEKALAYLPSRSNLIQKVSDAYQEIKYQKGYLEDKYINRPFRSAVCTLFTQKGEWTLMGEAMREITLLLITGYASYGIIPLSMAAISAYTTHRESELELPTPTKHLESLRKDIGKDKISVGTKTEEVDQIEEVDDKKIRSLVDLPLAQTRSMNLTYNEVIRLAQMRVFGPDWKPGDDMPSSDAISTNLRNMN